MECREAHSLIPDYIKSNMSDKKMAEFIQHVRTCRSCYHELETYFMIRYAIKCLDEDSLVSYNLQNMLVEDLDKKERQIKNNKNANICLTVFITIFILLILWLLIYLLIPEKQDFVLHSIEQLRRIITW